MRRVGDIMKDLGFNKDAPLETQKAFIRHLIRAANGSAKVRRVAAEPAAVSSDSQGRLTHVQGGAEIREPQQLSFDADILDLKTGK